MNGTDKNLLIMYSARELQEAMSMTDEVDINDKRFSVHSINEEGKAVSLAEECARLLRIGRTEGVKSEGGKYKKERIQEEFINAIGGWNQSKIWT